MKIETFNSAVRSASSDADGISAQDRSNLRSAFQMLTPADKEHALEFLLIGNFPRTYESVKDAAPAAQTFTFDSFKAGARAASGDADGMTALDLSNVRDAFSRLSTGDQSLALEFLATANMPRTYDTVKERAASQVPINFDAFKSAMRAGSGDADGMTALDKANAGDAFKRMSMGDQTRGLEYLLTSNMPATYDSVKDLAGSAVCIGLDAFKSGMRAMSGDADGMTALDRSNTRDAFKRLSTADQTHALEYLLTSNMPRTYDAVKDLATRDVGIGFDAFKSAMRATSGDADGMAALDLANARDAVSRLSPGDRERAAEYLMTSNMPRTFDAVKDLF